jgi:hypothetical protein
VSQHFRAGSARPEHNPLTIGISPVIQIRSALDRADPSRNKTMTAKFAVALIATTMFVAPALAADAVNSAAGGNAAAPTATVPAKPAAVSSTPASTNTSSKTATDNGAKGSQRKVERRHVHRTMTAHHGKTYVKTVKVTRAVKVVKSNPASNQAWPFGPFVWGSPEKTSTGVKVVHHHAHHMMVAHRGKPSGEVKSAAKPGNAEIKTVGTAPAAAPVAPAASAVGKTNESKPDAKVIKAEKDLKTGATAGKSNKDSKVN